MTEKTIIPCENCGRLLRAPADRGTIRVLCPHCQTKFILTPNSHQQEDAKHAKKSHLGWPSLLKIVIAISVLIVGGFALSQYFEGSIGDKGQTPPLKSSTPSVVRSTTEKRSSQWIRINYNDLIDKGTITHSGQTIESILNILYKIKAGTPSHIEGIYSELQPYLEPFSFICNDILVSAKSDDIMPYVNIVADYLAGSSQPAWAALFREGHYQLFIGDGKARLFLQGKSNPLDLFGQYYSVVRHPIRKALEKIGQDKMTLEVYAFENDYAAQTISLDINPQAFDVYLNKLEPISKALPLADLADFFNQGITLEAAEIDENANFYLYGTPSARQTLAGQPQTLEDFAVVYRSIFHHRYNAPYISLDRHEDNRFAKVNFGGLLEDTRVGSVILEADKLFKTMHTGLDPNTRTLIKGNIKKTVPDFMTAAERGLMEMDDANGQEKGRMQIRYWFYPDHIRCATDGRMGVVERYQLLAAAERMDVKVTLGQAQRDTIDHLNKNFADYTRALPTYRELNTVGRMMAIVTWLQQTNVRNQVDLDDLLSIELSPFKTPRHTKKLLAVTAKAYATKGAEESGGSRLKVYNFDSLLENMNPSINDDDILKSTNRHFREVEDPYLIYNSTETSVGGGINLRPKDFAKPLQVSDSSPLIQRIRSSRNIIRSSPGAVDGKTKSTVKPTGDIYANRNLARPWQLIAEQSSGDLIKKLWKTSNQESISVDANPKTGYVHHKVTAKGYFNKITVKPGKREVVIATNRYPTEIVATGNFFTGGTITLRRGKKIDGQISQKDTHVDQRESKWIRSGKRE